MKNTLLKSNKETVFCKCLFLTCKSFDVAACVRFALSAQEL